MGGVRASAERLFFRLYPDFGSASNKMRIRFGFVATSGRDQ